MKKIVLIFLMLFMGHAYAQSDSSKAVAEDSLFSMSFEDLLNLKATVNTGSFLDVDLKRTPATLTIISKEQIELSGARHLSEVLEIYTPGFQYMVNKWNGIIWGMRGVGADRNTKIIFLVNGQKMNHESRDGAMSELDLGLMHDIERIEVLRGPAGLVYGSGAIAGVVNIVTKAAASNEKSLRTNVHTYNMASNGGGIEANLNHKVNDDLAIGASFGARMSNGVGAERSRIYGKGSWPYPFWMSDIPADGAPVSGAAYSTPGNYRLSGSLSYKEFNVYTRATHQVTNASGWFIVDPWAEYYGDLDSLKQSSFVDGKAYPKSSFYGAIEPWGTNRRQYVVDNFTTLLTQKIKLNNSDNIMLSASYDRVSNRIQREETKFGNAHAAAERNTQVDETFGESRYMAGINYNVTHFSKLKYTAGYQFRIYDIGRDMNGNNSQSEKAKHPIVSNVTYYYHSLFAEGLYKLSPMFTAHAGARYDLHTRTKQFGGIITPKLGLVSKLSDQHIIKLVFQSSANNGSADNYEFNRNSINDDGQPLSGDDWHYERKEQRPSSTTPILPPVTEKDLHSLKPERSTSLELSSVHELNKNIMFSPSVSYNNIRDLFVWNQSLFRVMNGGQYNFVNVELEGKYVSDKVNIGISHAFQRVVNTDLNQSVTWEKPNFSGYDSTLVNGVYEYTPKIIQKAGGGDSISVDTLKPVKTTITHDGKHFLNLTASTKIYLDFKPNDWLTIHTNVRVFWGLKGRQPLGIKDPQFNYNRAYNSPMVKWNIGFRAKASDRLSMVVMAYDILGGPKMRHAIRWQQRGDAGQEDLYTVDLRSYSFNIMYSF
ncbi:MAG: TonB-dependent receptor plug domain-containing protein [Cytophagaceae bacterium]|jgi:outer membrane receptor for ferrienterochelin and colicin|nr:TonB-dependent receptor plug domain-containing protein [Cytophagaceae bacterium]